MKAILKPFFALCGLVALSTALSADSRLFPVGGGGAGWGEPGFLYSDYLQTAAASGREVEFQGSFVLDNRRPFLAELGTAFPGRVVDEVKSLPLREWGLGYVFEKRRPAHQRALLERGWRLADWLAEETLMAATESSRGGGLIRTLEFDLQSELGGRRAQVGLNVLGALRESNDEAIAWQFRGFKSSGGLGGNTGLIWRRAVANDRALAGANVFLDYETYADENFWRGSAGAELRSAWADVFGNVYRGFSDDVKKNNRTTYTADGYDVELNVHSPELPWLVGEVAYYNFEGKAGDKDDDGVRFGLRFNPLTDLELGVEYDNGDSDDDGKKKWAARIRYSGEFGGVLKAQYRPSTNSGNFEPRDWFFAPVEREYSQRIRRAGVSDPTVNNPRIIGMDFKVLPIVLRSDAATVALTISGDTAYINGSDATTTLTVQGNVAGRTVSAVPRPIPPKLIDSGLVIPTESTLTLFHNSGSNQTLTLFFPRTRTTIAIESTVAVATETNDFFRLIDGSADIMIGNSGGATVFIAEQFIDENNMRRMAIPVSSAPSAPMTLELAVDKTAGTFPAPPQLNEASVVILEQAVGGTTRTNLTASNPQGRAVLAQSNFLIRGTPPVYYREQSASGAVIVATLTATGGVGDYQWSETGNGELEVNSAGVVSIPTSANPTDQGAILVLTARLTDGRQADGSADSSIADIAAQTDDFTLEFTVSYRNIADLAATFNPAPAANVYGLTGEGQEITVATVVAAGGPGLFTYTYVSGELRVSSTGGNGGSGHVYIPSSVVPTGGGGSPVQLRAELSQPLPGDTETRTVAFSVTVQYIGVSRISPPAFAAADDKAILVNNPTSYQVTALSGDSTAMNIATLAEATGGGGTYTYTKMGGELGFSGRVVSIPASMSPTGQNLVLTVRIEDSGTGSDATPHVTVMLTVQYVSVERVNLGFDDRDDNPNDHLATVYALEGDATGRQNVARVVAGGGFGGVTFAKTNGELELSGTTSGAQVHIPANDNYTPQSGQGRALSVVVVANDDNDGENVTAPATATITLRYVEVKPLAATYYRVNPRNNSVGGAVGDNVLTVGMTQAVLTSFPVATVSVSEGGVGKVSGGSYTYRKSSGSSDLTVSADGRVEIAPNTQPGETQSMAIVVEVDDTGLPHATVAPPVFASITVLYNTIGLIAANVVDTRNNNAVIDSDGGTVYFISGSGNPSTEFGSLQIFGGFGNAFADYDVVMSNPTGGLTYSTSDGKLSMTKCVADASADRSIVFTINDKSNLDSGNITEPLTMTVTVHSGAAECLEHVSADVEDLSGGAVSQTLLRYGLEAVNAPSNVAVATIDVSGGTGDLSSTKTGELNLGGDSNRLLTVEIPAGTTPKAVGSANDLVLVAVLNDADANGGFLTNPATVSVTANYVAVPSVVLNLNRSGNPIDSVVDVYGKEGVAKTEKIADIMTGGGADGANVAATLRTDGTNPTTPNAFAISGNDLNLSRTFPAFSAGAQNVIAVVSANDSGGTQAHTDATPAVEKSATVRLLPVLAAVEEGGNIVEIGNADNVVAPTSPSATEANFTVYILAGAPRHSPPIAQVSAAAVTRNAGVAGASGLRIKAPERHADSTPLASGLSFNGGNPVAQVRINDGATATSGGADLKLVLEYDDEGFAPVHTLTESRRKTVNVHYETVAPFIVQARTADDSAVLPANEAVTAYVAAGATEEVRVARLNQVGGADGMDIVSQSGDLMAKKIGDVFYAVVTANTGIGNTLHLTVMMDDAPGAADNSPERAQGSQTQPVRLELTVAYLETQDVVASFANIPGDDHFLGAADSTSGVRTLYFKDSASRPAELDILRINIQSGSPPYTTDTSGTGFGLDGFNLKDGSNANNRVLALLQAKADGAMAVATVEIDDSGAAAAISDPITLTASVAVKHVEAIEVELIVPEDVPGGPTAGGTLGALYVRSAAAANSSSVHIANASASKGVEQFTYTWQSESSAELLLNADGEVHLAANYTPDGNKTLSIIIAANDGDSVDGSTLTEAAMITLEFVLAETIGAEVFLRNNGGAYVPNGTSANDVAWGSGMRTVKVKTADYGNEQLVVGVRGSGGLGNSPAYSIARATGGNENGLVTRTPSPDGYGLGVAVKDGAVASSAPQTFGITAVVNESGTDPNNLTPGATISLTVVYDKVDDIAAAFEDTDGDPISGRHVVARSEGVSNTDLMVASLNVSGGVGKDTGGDYTFTQDTPGDLIVNSDGEVLVKGGVVPAIGLNLSATVKINDTGNWAHVSDELEVEITVLYSSKVVLDATIVDTRDDAVPANIPRTGGIVYFLNDDPDENAVFARVDFSGALPGDDTYVVTASDEVGLSYDTSTRELSMTKCTDTPSATKSIKLTANDSPDTAGVSDPLVVEIEVTSGAAQCFDAISARPERLNAVRGAEITDIPKFYRLAGDELDADLPVATVHVDGGAPAYVSDKTGGVLNLVKGSQGELTVVIPSGRAPEASPNNLEIVLTVNDDSTKGGFLTDVAEVKMTVDFAEVQPHGNLQGVLADGVTGSLEDGLLTVRRVAASSTPLRIVTNIRPALPAEERIMTEGSFTNFQIVFNTTTSQQDLQLIAGQVPDGEVRMITVKVENHKAVNRTPDDDLQFAARPDKLFTIAVRYLGELEAAAYDSETETAIAGEVDRYVESDEGAVVVATVSVSGGTTPYTYSIDGGLELHGNDNDNMTVRIPETANPAATPGTKLTARIEINDTGRADTDSLNVDLTANYILIPGHSDLQLVRDGRTQAEDLNGETVYPKIVGAKSSGVVEALSGLAFKAGLSGETLKRESSGSAAALLFADDASVVQIAGDTEPDGSTLALVLRASDGESPAQAKARSDRLYTVQVRYMKELTADARDAASGGDVINAVRQIRVTEAEADDAHFVAHISVDGGAGGNAIVVGGTNFVISGNELRIAADVIPGDLATGKLLTATVKVNDDEAAVGGAETGEVEILVTANYITLPPVEGSFVEGRDGEQAVPTSAPVTVYSAWTPSDNAPATVAATAKATVGTRTSDTFTFHKIGTEGKLEVDVSSGAVMLQANRPQFGRFDLHTITVEFRAATNAVATQQTLTVRHQMVHPIIAAPNSFQSRPNCHPGNQINGTNDLEIVMAAGEEGSVWNASGQCTYLAFSRNIRVYNVDAPRLPIARTVKSNDGLNLSTRGNDHIVGVAGNTFTYTAERRTLSIVIAYNNTGPGSHVTDEYLRTVYIVFPGVPKIAAVLEDASGADAEITKPLTVYVGNTDTNAKLVASVKASGGAGSPYSYTGARTGGDSMALLVDSSNGEISVPANFPAVVSPGTNFQLEVAVDDSGSNAGVTAPAKVTLTLQYIKTSGPLAAEAVYTTPDIADATNTTYYGAKDEALGAAVNVANIAPSGGIPNYSFAIEEDSSNPAANSELEISGSGNTRVVRLKSGATPSAATSEARRRVITVRVNDTGDVGNSQAVQTMDVVVSVNFVEVEPHGDLTVENADGNNLGTDFVVVTSGVSAQDVVLAPADSVYSERPTRRQDLGREAAVVSEVSHHGLRFNSNGLVITANTPLDGQTLSVVVQATDGATSQPTASAQAAARQDQTYTISVRYVPAIAAEVLSTTNAALSNTDVVELTVVAGTQLVGKVSASGGVGGTYSYTPTPAQAGGTNLAVDADGNINIIAGTIPLAGDGLSITVNIAVDDDSADTEGDRDETSAANVQIRVKYVLLEDLALTAKDLQGNDVGTGATDTVGTFYLLEGQTTDAPVLVATVTASGGIKLTGGANDYNYAKKGGGGDLTFDPSSREVHIPNNKAAATPGSATATLKVTVEATDKRDVKAELIVQAVFETVQPLLDLYVEADNAQITNPYEVIPFVGETSSTPVQVINLVSKLNPEARTDTIVKVDGAEGGALIFGSDSSVSIPGGTIPEGQMLTLVLIASDGDRTDADKARPDRRHTLRVRYIPSLAAVARTADGTAVLSAPVEITSKPNNTHQVASISVSGGTSNTYTYSSAPLEAGRQNLDVSNDGIVSIPTGATPVANGGLSITVEITADDSGTDNGETDPAKARVTVIYHLLESPEIVAQDKDGTAALTAPGGANAAVFYQLSGTSLASDLPVAKVVGSKGLEGAGYRYAIEGDAGGMEVDTNGNIVLKSGASTTATGTDADRVIVVRLTDRQTPTAETADATITVRFEAVAPHPDLYAEDTNEDPIANFGDEPLTVVVHPDTRAAQIVARNLFVDSRSGNNADRPTLAKTKGELEYVETGSILRIAAQTEPTGQILSVVIEADDGADTPQKAARTNRLYSVTVRYMSHVAVAFTQNDGTTPLDPNNRINLQKIAGTSNPASLFVAKFEGRGGVGEITYSVSGNTEGGKPVKYDAANRVLYIDADFTPAAGDGTSVTVVVVANDNEAATNGVTQNIAITYREAPATPLSGEFVAAAPSSDSRIVGAFNDDERVTVFGLNADGTTDGLPVIALSHNNPNVGAGQISKLSGNLDYANGQVSIPAANRKEFGDVFAGVFEANDGSPATQNATYSITVLLSERLQGTARGQALYVDAGREDSHLTPNRGQYFYTANTESAVFRPVFTLPGITVEGLEVRSAGNNYEWDFATKQLRRNGAARANHAVAAAVTVLDPNANPKILPVPLALDLRNREVPALEIVNQDDSAADTTASQIAHTATPTTPIWTFRVKGGALTRTTYRPFHDLQVSGSGAFVVATLARVPGSGINEFADFEIRIDFTHTDAAQRRGQTLTLTVTAEDVGYPGLGAVSHVAEVILEAEPIPHVEAGLWTPEANSGTQISAPVEIAVLAAGAQNVASVSVSKGLPANNQVYDYTARRLDGGGNPTSDPLLLNFDENTGIISIPQNLAPGAGDGTTITLEIVVDDTGQSTTDPATVRLELVYKLVPALESAVQDSTTSNPVTEPKTIYRLAGFTTPLPSGLDVGVKVVASGGTPPYRYVIKPGNPNPGRLGINNGNGEVNIQSGQQPQTGAASMRTLTVLITDKDAQQTAEAIVTVHFVAVYPIVAHQFNFSSQAACHDGNRRTLGPNARLVMPVREEGFKFTGQTAPGSFGNCQFLGHFDDTRAANPASFAPTEFGIRGGSGNIVRTTKETVGNLEPIYLTDDTRVDVTFAGHTYTDGETEAKIVIAYNDQGPAKDLTPEFLKTLVVVFPGIPRVDAVLNDEGGSPINLTGIEKRGPGGEKVIIGTIVASGGTGSGYTYTKAATGGGALALDSNTGEVSIPDDVAPEAGAGAALHLLVDVDDGGTNSDRTTAKQLRIEVQYIEEQGAPPLAGEVQNADGNEVTAAPTVYRVTNVPTPDLGLPTGLKVVGSGGTAPYSYAAKTPQPPNNKRLLVSADGQVISIPSGQTATPSGGDTERLMTVVITDGAGDTVEVAVTVNFETVSGHGALTRELATDAAAGTGTNANTYYVANDGAQSGAVNVLTDVKSSEATNIEVVGIDSGLTFNYDTTANAGVVQIDAGTVPSGQTFAATVRATDGDSTPQAAGRLDRTFQFSVVYLEHLEAQLWDAPSGGATIDIATAIDKTSAAGASVFVGSVSVSGGTGAYEFTKGTSCTNLDVDADGNVFIPTSAAAPVASPGTPGSCQVIINDSGDGSAATPAHGAFNVQVNHILEQVVQLPPVNPVRVLLSRVFGGENRLYSDAPTGVPANPDHTGRVTVFTRNSDSAAIVAFSVRIANPGGQFANVTEGAGSDFSVGSASSGYHGVLLKAANLKRWGQLLEARFVADGRGFTMTVLVSEQLEDSALVLGPIGLAGQTDQNRPMQFNLPNDVEADTDYPPAPAFQALVDFPGVTVKGLVVNNNKGDASRGVRATTSSTPIVPLPISEYGDFFWNNDTRTLWRRGEVIRGGNPRYYVELMDPGANPKIIPTRVNFRATTRKLARMSWAASPGTISPSGNTSFEVQGGAQARAYSPFADMHATVNAPFVISNMRTTTPSRNNNRFHFDVSLPPGTPAGSYTATITVTDRGYTSFGTLTHTATATK